MSVRVVRMAVVTGLVALTGCATELKQETLDAWNAYLAKEAATNQQRVAGQDNFFWADTHSVKMAEAGTPLIAPFSKPDPLRVPGGLIHHWIGLVYIPNASIEDVMDITRDYAHYKDYYKPGVAKAECKSSSDVEDLYTVLFVNASYLTRTTLQGQYVSRYVRIDDKRYYSTSDTTQMIEIRDLGRPTEKQLSPKEGSGFIWRLYSTARMEERHGGVLIEMEALALTRDIPTAFRWIVDPIVRRVSRDSLEASLTDTARAVTERLKACPKVANQIIESGPCSQHAYNSGFRYQGLSRNASR